MFSKLIRFHLMLIYHRGWNPGSAGRRTGRTRVIYGLSDQSLSLHWLFFFSCFQGVAGPRGFFQGPRVLISSLQMTMKRGLCAMETLSLPYFLLCPLHESPHSPGCLPFCRGPPPFFHPLFFFSFYNRDPKSKSKNFLAKSVYQEMHHGT